MQFRSNLERGPWWSAAPRSRVSRDTRGNEGGMTQFCSIARCGRFCLCSC
jgi:hypothetical protein